MYELVAYIYMAMATWVPPSPGDTDRYETIARDIVDEASRNPLYDTDDGAARTALLMASIAGYESFYRKDVDSGKVKGDNGQAHCLMQVHPRPGEDLSTHENCFRVALERMHESYSACRFLKPEYRLSAYTRGTCAEDKSAEWRYLRAVRWWKAHPFSSGVD